MLKLGVKLVENRKSTKKPVILLQTWYLHSKVLMKVRIVFRRSEGFKKCGTMKQGYPLVLSTALNKVVLTSKSVDEVLKRDHLNESY